MQFFKLAAAFLPLVSALINPTLNADYLSRRANTTDPCAIVGEHVVVSGDTLTTMNITDVNFISIGQVILIPDEACNDVAPPTGETPATTATCAPVGTAATYTMIAGDTLTIIAAHYSITLDALVAANTQIANIDVIEVGDVINIPVCTS